MEKQISLILLIIAIQQNRVLSKDYVVRTAPIGQIRGITENKTIDGTQYPITKFLGIPYGKAPIGQLRFRKPEPVDPWSDVINATEIGPSCVILGNPLDSDGDPALREKHQPYSQSEDCLQLNIYYPGDYSQNSVTLKPVMVFIHGGGYMVGTQNGYDGSVLALLEDVIYVTMNYRLGLLGFASTADGQIPGNMGLFDQHLALQWIQNNIAAFGGDPDGVTIFGESAGADAVMNHLVSPLSNGLFLRVISQSPPRYVRRNRQQNSELVKSLLMSSYSTPLGTCASLTSSDDVLTCLNSLSVEDLTNFLDQTDQSYNQFTNSPAIIDGEFVPDDVPVLLREGRYNKSVDVMVGYNGDDGSIALDFIFQFNPDALTTGISREAGQAIASVYLPVILDENFNERNQAAISAIVFREYFLDKSNLETVQAVIDLARHASFAIVIAEYVNAMASFGESGKVYTYRYDYKSSESYSYFSASLYGLESNIDLKALHGDEIYFVLGLAYENGNADRKIARSMMKSWADFARNGEPVYINSVTDDVITWEPYTVENNYVLQVEENLNSSSLKTGIIDQDWVDLWNEIIFPVAALEGSCPDCSTASPEENSNSDENYNSILGLSFEMTDILLITAVSAAGFLLIVVLILHCYILNMVCRRKKF